MDDGSLDVVVRRALEEDLGPAGDVTSGAIVPDGVGCVASAVAKEAGVVAGLAAFARSFQLLDPAIELGFAAADGDRVEPGTSLARVAGPARSVLAAERVALNFLGHLSGVATLTRAYVDACGDTGAVILHTRKTLPGLRALQREAVLAGGGRLHRGDLSEAVLVKDNHVAIAGGVGEAVRRARGSVDENLHVQAEVESLEELEQAIEAGADSVLLDNADIELSRRAVELVAGRVAVEVSGRVALESVPELAALGPLRISVGWLTHSAPALDVSLEMHTSSTA